MRIAYLHGFAGDPAAWQETLAALPRHDPRAIALPGHGGGSVLPTWDECLAAIAGAVGEVELVVGYSLGARAALGLAATGRVPRAILVGVNPGMDDAERAARRASDAAWARLTGCRSSATSCCCASRQASPGGSTPSPAAAVSCSFPRC